MGGTSAQNRHGHQYGVLARVSTIRPCRAARSKPILTAFFWLGELPHRVPSQAIQGCVFFVQVGEEEVHVQLLTSHVHHQLIARWVQRPNPAASCDGRFA